MDTTENQKTNWTICHECYGQGKIVREPSRKRRRLHHAAVEAFRDAGGENPAPAPLNRNMDICLHCTGSGLQSSDSAVTPNSKDYPTVAIIGGGIGGVALAVACLHRGIPFTLYERDERFDARSQGYGLTLQQASNAIRGLGIFHLDGGITSTRHVVHNPDGKIIGEWGLRKWKRTLEEKISKRKNVHIARQSLRLALLEQLNDSESVKWGYELKNVCKNSKGSINLSFKVGAKNEVETADLVVGADGIYSTVRELLISETETPL